MSNQRKFTSIDTLQNSLINKPLISTKLTAKITQVLTQTKSQNRMIGLIGEEGMGKSTAIAHYVFSNQKVYYIRMGQSYTSKTLFHELIFLITGKEVYESTGMNNSINYLSSLLTDSPEKKLVIIDDAGKLKSSGLGLFHELRDNTKHTTGFAFIGLQYFKGNLEKWSKEGKVGISEFLRRIEFWYSVPYLTEQEKIEYLKVREIEFNDKVRSILHEVNTIWQLEFRINVYLEQKARKE